MRKLLVGLFAGVMIASLALPALAATVPCEVYNTCGTQAGGNTQLIEGGQLQVTDKSKPVVITPATTPGKLKLTVGNSSLTVGYDVVQSMIVSNPAGATGTVVPTSDGSSLDVTSLNNVVTTIQTGIMIGLGNGLLDATDPATGGALATVALRLSGVAPPSGDNWDTGAVSAARATLLKGTTIDAHTSVTPVDVGIVLANLLGLKPVDPSTQTGLPWQDVSLNTPGIGYLLALKAAGVDLGVLLARPSSSTFTSATSLHPNATLSRADLAVLIGALINQKIT